MRNIAFLWWEENVGFGEKPFDWDTKREEYRKFSQIAREKDIRIVLGEYRWYTSGSLEKCWVFDGEWKKKEDIEIEGVYDLFHLDDEKMEYKKRMKEEVGIMDDPELTKICHDKLLTYQEFPEMVPETRKATDEDIRDILSTYGKAVLKPRRGSSGDGIIKVESEEFPDIDEDEYVVQRFMETEGTKKTDFEGIHDLRVLMINGEIQYAYIRSPNKGFRSNLAKGGTLEYVDVYELPEDTMDIVDEVRERFSGYAPSVLTVDLMYDEFQRPWILELNTQPGIGYHGEERVKEKELPVMKKLVDAVSELAD
ncbi:MAG: RimK family alpha-L-glutamate ligase [Candidatus Nanohaloarchaea archaeon]